MTQLFASEWIAELGELLAETRVTDGRGAPMSLDEGAERAVDRLVALGPSQKVMLVGNGGSAAIVQHMHNDIAKSVGLRAQVFYETPLLTAITNDDGYAQVFEQPVARWAEPGDVLVAVSSSGRSENILRAVRAAKRARSDVITLSGFDEENPLRQEGLVNFWVASRAYGPVEAAHTALTHYLTDRAAARRST